MGENMLEILRGMLECARYKADYDKMKAVQTVIGDLQRVDKDYVSRDQLVAYVKAQMKAEERSAKKAQELNIPYDPDHVYLSLLADLEFDFAPQQLTELQIRQYFAELTKLNPNMNKGLLMKAIKEEFPGRYDGKLAAQIAGEFHTNK